MKKLSFNNGIGAFSFIGLFSLFVLSMLFPRNVMGLTQEYGGLLGFLMSYYLEPLYWLFCAGIVVCLCFYTFERNTDAGIKRYAIIIISLGVLLLLMYITGFFIFISLPYIVFFTIWLIVGLLNFIFPIFLIKKKKGTPLTFTSLVTGIILLGLGGLMRLFLTM